MPWKTFINFLRLLRHKKEQLGRSGVLTDNLLILETPTLIEATSF
jgi:hypothetical protein